MNPVRFGPAARQLFGIHHPATGNPLNLGVLMCNPFGQEAIRSHRLFRVLGDQLARAGFDVMRFDYYGTGDSAGDDEDGNLERWYDDCVLADAELRHQSQCQRVSWLGLRLGASIAAVASARCPYPLKHLLLWDPIIDGATYLVQLRDAHIAARREAFGARWALDQRLRNLAHREAESEALGFLIPSELREQIRQLSVPLVANARAQSISLLAAPDDKGMSAFQISLKLRNSAIALHAIDKAVNWMSNEAMDSTIAPPASLKIVMTLLMEDQ